MGLPNVKIINPDCKTTRTRCFIGNQEIPNVISADLHVSVDEVPIFNFVTAGFPDIEMNGRVVIEFHPDTVVDAIKVLQHELLHDKTLYSGFLSSIESALKEAKPYTKESDLAKAVLDRLIGKE